MGVAIRHSMTVERNTAVLLKQHRYVPSTQTPVRTF
jgi:hypothetical protein